MAKLLPYQRDDFAGIFRSLNGLPATIRFLDPPLHEFLPQRRRAAGRTGQQARRAGRENRRAASHELHEFNPMLGFRGCRLGISYPEISAMQARAIFEAAIEVQKKGIKVKPEIMIPLVGFAKELELQVALVRDVAAEVSKKAQARPTLVGTMIEIPRACVVGRRDRQGSRVLQLRHQRPDPDRRSA